MVTKSMKIQVAIEKVAQVMVFIMENKKGHSLVEWFRWVTTTNWYDKMFVVECGIWGEGEQYLYELLFDTANDLVNVRFIDFTELEHEDVFNISYQFILIDRYLFNDLKISRKNITELYNRTKTLEFIEANWYRLHTESVASAVYDVSNWLKSEYNIDLKKLKNTRRKQEE